MELPPLKTLHETTLQRLVREVLSDSSREWLSVSGVPLQILSLGEWNHAAGPDFLSVAVAAEGRVHVGNAEFHRAASDWLAHEHSRNPAYSGLLLHIVVRNDSAVEFARYTLVVPEAELTSIIQASMHQINILEASSANITASNRDRCHWDTSEIVHTWAVRRLTRKSEYAFSILNPYKPHETLLRLLAEFYERQSAKKRRPRGMAQVQALQAFLQNTPLNVITEFLTNFTEEDAECVGTILTHLLEHRIHTEGAATRQELLLNITLPLGIALCKYYSKKAHSEELWQWFFALPAQNAYTVLQQRFPTVQQDLAYQQQGLLEYLAETYPPQSRSTTQIHTLRPETAHVTAEYVITVFAPGH